MIKRRIFGFGLAVFGCTIVSAGTMGPITAPETGLRPMASLQGGYASMNAGNNRLHRFVGADDDVFTYTNSDYGKNKGFIGGFLGVESPVPWLTAYPSLLMQIGVEYNYFEHISVSGINTVGIEPETSTLYNYHYNFNTQQVLGLLKLLTTHYGRFYPYGEVGLGVALNRNNQYVATTTETGSINIAPTFNNQNNTQFSYSLGLGIDAEVTSNIRVGLGYRYSNFGSSSFDNGMVRFNNYQAAIPFTLGASHADANQLLARISYIA